MPHFLASIRRIVWILLIVLPTGILPPFASTAAAQNTPAQNTPAKRSWFSGPQEPRLELFVSSLFANSASEGSFGLRGAVHARGRFHFEGSLSRLDDNRVDLWMVDLSAKYYLRERERTAFYLVAGPGLFYSSDLDAEELMVHLGVGLEVAFGPHFYLRPELRGRWFTDHLGDSTVTDLSLGFGWRF